MKHDRKFLQRIFQSIDASPLRMTQKRERLLGALIATDRPASAADLRDSAGFPESDLVTVYRTLNAFENIGIVQSIPMEENGYLFELTEPNDHYHHFICRECHLTERLDFCMGEELEKQAQKLGFSEVTHLMEVYGTCKDCQVEPASGS